MKKGVISILIILLLAFGGFVLFKKRAEELKRAPKPFKPPIAVTVKKVKLGTLEIKEHYTGVLLPVKEVILATKVSGWIEQIAKDVGDRFKKGDLLVKVDSRELKAKLRALKSQLFGAEEELAVKKKIFLRNEVLLKHEAISQEAFDVSKMAFELAKSKVNALKDQISALEAQLSYSTIRAPFSGIVLAKLKNTGDFVAPGMPILKVLDPSKGYKLIINLPQEKVTYLKPGKKVYVKFGEKVIIKRIFKVYPETSPSGLASIEVRFKKSPFNLPVGSTIGVDVVFKRVKGFVLPIKSLVTGKRKGVYVFENGHLKFVPVKVLGISGGLFVAKGDLKPGDEVVVGDPGLLLRLYPGEKAILGEF